jgi:hypothetical protein
MKNHELNGEWKYPLFPIPYSRPYQLMSSSASLRESQPS